MLVKLLLPILWGFLSVSKAFSVTNYHSPHASSPYHFKMNIVDAKASGAYGLIAHDINQDGYTDLVSFAYSGTTSGNSEGEIYWYEFLGINSENDEPQWTKHLITKKKHVVHGAFFDVDHDNLPDLVFMSNFEVPIKDESKEGDLWWAKRPLNLNDSEWKTYWIGRTPGAHRIAALDLGHGSKGILVIPLFSKGKPPLYGSTSITLYVPKENPTLPWDKKIFSNLKLHAIHDAIVVRKNNSEDLLLASKEGITQISFYKKSNGEWDIRPIQLHSSPIASLNSSRDKGTQVLRFKNQNLNLSGITSLSEIQKKSPFIAAIDYDNQSGFLADQPWHGDTVSIYAPKEGNELFSENNLERKILEKRSAGGHAVQLIDFTQNGCPDVLAGFRAYPTGLIIYHCKKDANSSHYQFEKQIISERSANAIVVGYWDKTGIPGFATAGFGYEGDPYILLWRLVAMNGKHEQK